MDVGCTGTREGLTPEQGFAAGHVLRVLFRTASMQNGKRPIFRHGDCVGSDEALASMARLIGYAIIGHPPTIAKRRANFPSDLTLDPQPYLVRNAAIVKASAVIVACPKGMTEQAYGSGTWHTVFSAREHGVPYVVVWPNGQCAYSKNWADVL